MHLPSIQEYFFCIHFHHIIAITFLHSSTTIHIHLMVSVNIFKTVGMSLSIFFDLESGKQAMLNI